MSLLFYANKATAVTSRGNIFLVPLGALQGIIARAEALDREAFQIASSINHWIDVHPSPPQCVACSTSFDKKQTGGWIVIIPASLDTDPIVVIGVCRQCIGQPDLLSRALACLEAEAGIVVVPGCAGRG